MLVGGFNYVPNCIKMGQFISRCNALPIQGHIYRIPLVVFSHRGKWAWLSELCDPSFVWGFAGNLKGNRFKVVLRNVSADEDTVRQACEVGDCLFGS